MSIDVVRRLRRALVLAGQALNPVKTRAVAKLLLAAEREQGVRLTAAEVRWLAGTYEVQAHGESLYGTLLTREEKQVQVDEHGTMFLATPKS